MAGDRFQKTQAGRPLEIPAATWNAMIDAARAHAEQQHRQDTGTDLLSRQADLVKVRNESGQDLPRFSVLGIDTPVIPPEANEREFKNQVALRATLPDQSHTGRFVVLHDPLRANRIGRAWVSGVCVCRVQVEQDWHTHAVADPGNTGSLLSKPDGAAQILWRQSGLGLRWAVVRLSTEHRTHFLAKVPTAGIPARSGQQTGSATCDLYTVDQDGVLEPVTRPGGETVSVRVRHAGPQPIRGPVDPAQPQYLGVTFDGHNSWLLDPPKQTLLCKPLGRIRAQSWGTARELRFQGGQWAASGSVVSVYNVCDYALLATQQIICHFHEDTTAYLTIGCRCCDGSSSSMESSSSSKSSSDSSSSSRESSSSSDSSSSSGKPSASSSSLSLSSSDSSSSSVSGGSESSSDSSSSDSSSSSNSRSGSSSSSSSRSDSSASNLASSSSSSSSGSSSRSRSRSSDSSSSSESSSDSSDSNSSSSGSHSSQSDSSSDSQSQSQPSDSDDLPSGSPSSSHSESTSTSDSVSASHSQSDSRSHSQSESDSRSVTSESHSNPPSEPPPESSSSGCYSTWLWSCGWELLESDCSEPVPPEESGSYDGQMREVAG